MNVIVLLYGFSDFLLAKGGNKEGREKDAFALRTAIKERLLPVCAELKCRVRSLLVQSLPNELAPAHDSELRGLCFIDIILTDVPRYSAIRTVDNSLSVVCREIVRALSDYNEKFADTPDMITARIRADTTFLDMSWAPTKKRRKRRAS